MTAMLEGCESCEFGWRIAPDSYVDERFPFPANATPAQIEAVWARRSGLYGTFVLPCPDCRPTAFTRWANGCWLPDHRAGKCDLCLEAMGQKAASGHDRSLAAVGRAPGGDL